jgi:hypothetical protein
MAASTDLMQALRASALRHPGVTEGIACASTTIESRTIKVGKAAFVFLRSNQARMKLADSLAEASRLQLAEPGLYEVGSKGWVKVTWSSDQSPPLPLMARWIDESYLLMSPTTRPPASVGFPPSKTP